MLVFVCFCRQYVLDMEELAMSHVDLSIPNTYNGTTYSPTCLKNHIWQYIITYNQYCQAIKFLMTKVNKKDQDLIKYVLQNDFHHNLFTNVKIKNLLSLDSDLLDYILTYLNDDDKYSFQHTTTLTYPPMQLLIRDDITYRKSFSVTDLDRYSVQNFLNNIGQRVFTAKLLYSVDLFAKAYLQELLQLLQSNISINSRINCNNNPIKPNFNDDVIKKSETQNTIVPTLELFLFRGEDNSAFATYVDTLSLHFVCLYLSLGQIIKIGVLNRYWYNKILCSTFLKQFLNSRIIYITPQDVKNSHEWLTKHWYLHQVQILNFSASIIDVIMYKFPFVQFSCIQYIRCKCLHFQKFPTTLKVLHVEASNKSWGPSPAFTPLKKWTNHLELLIVAKDTSSNVYQYLNSSKIIWHKCVVQIEHIIDALQKPDVWFVCLQNCHNTFPFLLLNGNEDIYADNVPQHKCQTVFVCINSSTWCDLKLIFSVGKCYTNFIRHVYIKQNYNTVDAELKDFLDTLIDVSSTSVEKIITLLFTFNGTVYLNDDTNEGPEEIIFSWCKKNYATVFFNEKIISFVIGIIDEHNENKSKSFDLKTFNSINQVHNEYFAWGRCVYTDSYVQPNSMSLWSRCWQELLMISKFTNCPKLQSDMLKQ